MGVEEWEGKGKANAPERRDKTMEGIGKKRETMANGELKVKQEGRKVNINNTIWHRQREASYKRS